MNERSLMNHFNYKRFAHSAGLSSIPVAGEAPCLIGSRAFVSASPAIVSASYAIVPTSHTIISASHAVRFAS